MSMSNNECKVEVVRGLYNPETHSLITTHRNGTGEITNVYELQPTGSVTLRTVVTSPDGGKHSMQPLPVGNGAELSTIRDGKGKEFTKLTFQNIWDCK
jgi:hypothetical protein